MCVQILKLAHACSEHDCFKEPKVLTEKFIFQDADFRLNSLRSFLTDSSLDFVDTVLLTADSESDIIDSIILEIKNYICGQSSIVHVRRSFNLRQQVHNDWHIPKNNYVIFSSVCVVYFDQRTHAH